MNVTTVRINCFHYDACDIVHTKMDPVGDVVWCVVVGLVLFCEHLYWSESETYRMYYAHVSEFSNLKFSIRVNHGPIHSHTRPKHINLHRPMQNQNHQRAKEAKKNNKKIKISH